MVDATSDETGGGPVAAAEAGGAVSARVIEGEAAIGAAIAAIAPDMVFTGYQHPAALAAWAGRPGRRPMFIECALAGHGPVLLPLELGAHGIAAYCGGRHANGNFPVGRREDMAALADAGQAAIRGAIAAARPPATAIFLERQHARWEGVRNPFVFDASVPSPNIALSFRIEGDFETVLKTHGGKSKRKKIRSYRRKLDAAGQVAFHHPVPPDRVLRHLDRFLALKAERFRAAGIGNVFGDADTQNVFRALFGAGGPVHRLHALTLDERIIAVIGCIHHRGRLTVEFGSFDPDHAQARPGEQLFYSTIEHACRTGVKTFDFGIGDEPYKRAWCDVETMHHDTNIGLTPVGKVRAMARNGRSRAVRAIKSDDRVWSMVKRARRAFASR